MKIPPHLFGFVSWLALGVCLAIFLLANGAQNPFLRDGEAFYFVDADCYSRMTRVRILAEVEPFEGRKEAVDAPFLRQHFFENFPEGTRPHTTAPMDFLIWGMWRLVGGGEGCLDWVGWLISPVLGCLLIVMVWSFFLRNKPYRWSTVFLLCISPILLHGFAFGRPDHQSLLIFLVGGAVFLESEYLRLGKRWFSVAAGFFWGLGMWVSWFEPFVLWIVTQLFYAGKSGWERRMGRSGAFPWEAMGIGVGFMVLVIGVEGVPSVGVSPEMKEFFVRWAGQIGELRTISPWLSLAEWGGYFSFLLPFLLVWQIWRTRSAQCGYLLVLFLVLGGLSWWMVRWGYFWIIVVAAGTPLALSVIRWRVVGYSLFFLGLWPVAAALESRFYPEGEAEFARAAKAKELRDLRMVAEELRGLKGGGELGSGVLAPWWHTPALVYWSGKNGVAGSSHQSLPGTVDSARFFLETDRERAMAILDARKGVGFVVVGVPEHSIENSLAILGMEQIDEPSTMAYRLFSRREGGGERLRFVYGNGSFRLYEVQKKGELR